MSTNPPYRWRKHNIQITKIDKDHQEKKKERINICRWETNQKETFDDELKIE